jgi:hypothetical protein
MGRLTKKNPPGEEVRRVYLKRDKGGGSSRWVSALWEEVDHRQE